jgi:hypothetical protein
MPTQVEVLTLRERWSQRANALVAIQFDDEWQALQAAGMNIDAIDLAAWQNVLWGIWRGAGGDAADMVRRELLGRKTLDDLIFALDDAAHAIASHAISITSTTVDALTSAPVGDWFSLYDDWGGFRSQLVGMNEVQQAVAWASHEQARVMGTTFKAWRTMGDTLVRPSHQQAEFEVPIPLDQPFLVGGSNLRYPGDSSGPPEEVINCRCWETFIDF